MNKELEALQKLRDLVEYLTRIDYVPTDLRNEVKELLINSYEDSNGYFSQIEEALNELEDAKHNYKAVEEMYNNSIAYGTKIQKELNELKKRNEPMKVDLETIETIIWLSRHNYFYHCPKCGETVIERHYNCCPMCEQKLDWSDEK